MSMIGAYIQISISGLTPYGVLSRLIGLPHGTTLNGVYLYVESRRVEGTMSKVTIFFSFFFEKWKTNGKQIRRIKKKARGHVHPY